MELKRLQIYLLKFHIFDLKDKAKKKKTLNFDYPWKPPPKPPIPSTQNISCTVNNKPKTLKKMENYQSLIRERTKKWTKFSSSFVEV